jgi:hypothetical protein
MSRAFSPFLIEKASAWERNLLDHHHSLIERLKGHITVALEISLYWSFAG